MNIASLSIASNRNDILTRFFKTGEMRATKVVPTLSPSMDIQISSNFERYLFDAYYQQSAMICDLMNRFKNKGKFVVEPEILARAQSNFQALRADDTLTLATMAIWHQQHNITLDPHTAVGVYVASHLRNFSNITGPIVTLATAHPAKFPDSVARATGHRPELPPHLSAIMTLPEHMSVLPADPQKLKDFILAHR